MLVSAFSILACFTQFSRVSAQTEKQVQQIGDFYHQRDGFNGEIVVAQRGHIIAKKVYGYANQELKVPLTPETRFAVGSVTKQITAACILLLQEQGKLKTTDPIGLYLSSPPPAWKDVTIRDLLTHTSGITNDVLAGNAFTQFDHGVHTPQELIDAVRELPLRTTPGSKYEYNNLGYVILGAIIEKVSGERFAKFLHDRILGPLDMKDTNLGGPPETIPGRAFGYIPADGKLLDAEWVDPSVLGAAGAMYSTGADLVKWIDALENGRVLKPASLAEKNSPRLEDYGYGMLNERQYGVEVIGHNGDIEGSHALVEFYPHSNAEFVVLTNVSIADVEPKRSPGTYANTGRTFQYKRGRVFRYAIWKECWTLKVVSVTSIQVSGRVSLLRSAISARLIAIRMNQVEKLDMLSKSSNVHGLSDILVVRIGNPPTWAPERNEADQRGLDHNLRVSGTALSGT